MRSRRRGGEGGAAVMKKGPWSPWEDELLVEYVSKHGEGNWKEVALRSGLLRCGKSCRLRWTNQLRPHLRRDRFTPEEEATILLLHSIHGNKWAKISAQLPGRTDNSIKNFMNTRAKRQRRQGSTSTSYNSSTSSVTCTNKSASSSTSATTRAHLTSFSTSYNAMPQDPNHSLYASMSPWSWAPHRSSSASTAGAEARTANFPQVYTITRVATPTPTALQNGGAAAAAAAGMSCDTPPLLPSYEACAAGTVELPSLLWLSQEMSHGCKLTNRDQPVEYMSTSAACPRKLELPEFYAPRPQMELPSVQYSSSRSYSDPLALLGGESVSLFKDDHHLSSNTSWRGADPTPLANLASTLESINNCDSDYTLECIIKPLAAWSTMPAVALNPHRNR